MKINRVTLAIIVMAISMNLVSCKSRNISDSGTEVAEQSKSSESFGSEGFHKAKSKKTTKIAISIESNETKSGYDNIITLDDNSIFTVKTKHKLVAQEELDQLITVDSEKFDYIKIPSIR